MDLLNTYASSASDDDDDNNISPTLTSHSNKTLPPKASRYKVNPAPRTVQPASLLALSYRPQNTTNNSTPRLPSQSSSQSSSQLLLYNNPRKSTLLQPIAGPCAPDPNGPKPQSTGKIYHNIESNYAFDEVTFDEQRTNFLKIQKALGPDENGDIVIPKKKKRKKMTDDDEDPLVQDSDDEHTYGIWGPPSKVERDLVEDSITDAARNNLSQEQIVERDYIKERDRRRGILPPEESNENPNANPNANPDDKDNKDHDEATPSSDNLRHDRLVERKMSHLLPPRPTSETIEPITPSTTFHGSSLTDYRGRSWMHPPAGTAVVDDDDDYVVDPTPNYLPQKCIHRFTGHNKGVHRIRLLPRTGHLLLSAGLDGKCKVWSIPDKRVMRTYVGHSAAVRDVSWSKTGERFLSCGFDRLVRLWDTESGEVLGTFTNRRVPYTCKFYPKDENFFVVGGSDNKIVCYDVRTGEVCQEYDHHLGPVNSVTFVEDAKKFISSGDDKKILVWEWDISVPIKYISDPTMHSIPVMTMHPSGLYVLGQSLDNKIVVYQAKDRFGLMKKKLFRGHRVAGYACDMAVSPDGRFVCSGDGDGKLYFWDWRMHKILQKYRAHDKGPTVGCVWHPTEPSMMFTCGWDGVIKMWK